MMDAIKIRTVTVRDLEGLSDHAEAWDRLAWSAPRALPSLLPAWIEAFFRHQIKPHEGWFCSFAYRLEELVGVLPVVVKPHPLFGRAFPLLQTPFDNLTNSGDIALASEHAGPTLAALLDEARREQPRHLGLALPAVRQNSSLWKAVAEGFSGHAVMRGRVFPYDKIDLRIGTRGYHDQLGGNLKRNLKRYRKKLDGKGVVTVELRSGRKADESLLQEFLELENSGWKRRAGTALLQRPSETAFYKRVVQNFAERERLEWHLIKVDGRLIAAGLGIRCGGSLMLPRIAFDESFADCQPGTLLTGEVNEAAYGRTDLFELNHMSAAPWHRNWNMVQEDYATIHLVRKAATAAVFHHPILAGYILLHQHIKPRIRSDWKAWIKQGLTGVRPYWNN
ncbi:GNAT family N-acetyltransferase [Aurantimonas sp. DM33-3]|uniref:GNAT family N-acetyltransferase n=1 Tax=Aurantimonas sp. DM33-3 TaxID=2766955 RepID=UPI001652A81D|nr:GNAT family N-acetyltransferase [Aurantimonas sp. DM33-3]